MLNGRVMASCGLWKMADGHVNNVKIRPGGLMPWDRITPTDQCTTTPPPPHTHTHGEQKAVSKTAIKHVVPIADLLAEHYIAAPWS